MKKSLLLLFVIVLGANIYAQEDTVHKENPAKISVKEQSEFGCLIRFKPLATVVGILAYHGFDFEVAVVPYA